MKTLEPPTDSSNCRSLTAVDAFSGPGGLSLRFIRAGFTVRAAFDKDQWSVAPYRRNFGEPAFQADARHVTGFSLRAGASLQQGEELDLFAGGPPCQGFSKQKRGAHLGDER